MKIMHRPGSAAARAAGLLAVSAGLLAGGMQAASASPLPGPGLAAGSSAPRMLSHARATRIAHAEKPLAGCALTFFPRADSNRGRTCLQPMTAAQKTAARNAAIVHPAAPVLCSVAYYQNGPYESVAWSRGWAQCAEGPGNILVPAARNDQASSWWSPCSGGTFYVNRPGTSPSATFPAGSAGNFPRGAVPNDSLSSLHVNRTC